MAVLLVVALWPEATEVEVGSVTRGAMAVTVDGEGETRVHHRFVVSTPMAGLVERIELEPGNGVEKGQTIVARLHPEPPPPLDRRSRAEAAAAVEAARRAEAGARADEERSRAALDLAATELKREQELYDAGLTTQQTLEARRNLVVSGEESVSAAQYATAAAAAELERAQARLSAPRGAGGGKVIEMLAPVDGVVLKRFHEGEGVVAAGERLLEIGDPSHVQIVAELPAGEAAKVEPGMRVEVEHWGGDTPLAARVERVEPSGNVIIDFEDDRAAWRAMGDAFRMHVRVAIWEAQDALRVPIDALVEADGQPSVFVIQNGRARKVPIEIGHRTAQQVEVLKGLSAGQQVVLGPPPTLTDGTRVAPRP